MSEFEELLHKTAGVLDQLDIPYVVTGGAGVVAWGRPRFTADIDIAVELKTRHVGPLVAALRTALGETAMVDEQMVAREQERRGEFNVLHLDSGIKLDFFVLHDSPFDRAKLARRQFRTIGGQRVAFISPEDLIVSKLVWYRETPSERQLDDARSIVAIQGERLDRDYLKTTAAQLGLTDLLTQVLPA